MAEQQQQPQVIIAQQRPQQQQNQDVNLTELMYLCLGNWKWFVLSVLVCIGAATFKLLRTAPVYTRTASVLIKQDTKGKSIGNISNELSNLGLVGSTSSVDNELIAFKSPALVLELVQQMHLEVSYLAPGTWHKKTLYGTSLPVTAEFLDVEDSSAGSFTLTLKNNGTFAIGDFKVSKDLDVEGAKSFSANGVFGDTIATPMGRVILAASAFYAAPEDSREIIVNRSSVYAAAQACKAHLAAALSDKRADVIDLTYNDVSTQRAEDVLNTLIAIYNQKWVQDKNQIAVSTSQFINERLNVIEQELGNVDSDISSYKSSNLMPDIQAASAMYMNQANQANQVVMELNNQLYMCRYLRSFVTNDANKFAVLPANSGISDLKIEQLITTYNTKLLQRNTMAAASSTKNPMVVDADIELNEMRHNVILSLDNQITALQAQVNSQERTRQQSTSQLASNPTREKFLLSVERQQKVKEALYLFLLQKREENELSQAFTAYNTRIITPPMGSQLPSSPNKKKILAIAFLLGLMIPFAVIYLRETLYTKVRGRKDIEKLTMPSVGELPEIKAKGKLSSREKSAKRYEILVKPGSKDVINEAFRIVRSNLQFMVGPKSISKAQVIMLTSTNRGSGKTFVSINLATTFAIQGSKVCVVDMDLRKRSLSRYVGRPKQGITDYLNGLVADWHDILVKNVEDQETLSVIPGGHLAPNPAELLQSPRLAKLVEELKAEFDYIVLDCPPAEVVADTNIIKPLAELTIFVIRVGVMERALLPNVEAYYKDKKFNNLTVLLNGSELQGNKLSSRRYSYGYGYGYGYGYDDKK